MKLSREYPHLTFRKKWDLSDRSLIRLGQCISMVKAIGNMPILPEYYSELMRLAIIKGAQSTTAIEGNTLNDEEIEKIVEGETLPPSKEYQQIEVQNIIAAFNELLKETVYQNKSQLITPEFLLRLHRMVGRNLGEHFAAIPGRFRDNEVTVGKYRCPDHRDVSKLIELYCQFLREQFKFEDGNQVFSDIFIQAIVAHVYLEWIHPFSDGNGRTGRLLEFYILSRGGNPDITLHILSNYYNNTRPEYYRQLDKASKSGDLTEFIEYALLGFRDGLKYTLEKIQMSQLHTFWQKFVYDSFNSVVMGHRDTFKRRRTLALEIPIDRKFRINDVPDLNIQLAKLFSGISERTLARDIEELINLKIIVREGKELFANIMALNPMYAKSKGLINPLQNHQRVSTSVDRDI